MSESNESQNPVDVDLRDRIAERSIEIRIVGDDVVCDWGVIANPDGNPALPVGPLILATGGIVRELLRDGPSMDKYGHVNSVRNAGGSYFFDAVTTDRTERRWTWKLFPAHWWDRSGDDLFVGRWMD